MLVAFLRPHSNKQEEIPMIFERIQDVYISHYYCVSGTLAAKHWIVFMIIRSVHLQFPQAIVSPPQISGTAIRCQSIPNILRHILRCPWDFLGCAL